ncbi:MAG: hypothetical protein GXO03_02245 [Aquificae bacterium]|nr:hypothetical protein [Aquificota bacterium]
MWLRLILSRFFLQLLRFLLAPLFALTLGAFVLTLLGLLTYVWLLQKTLELYERHPFLGGLLIALEALLAILFLFAVRRAYLYLKERVKGGKA